MLEYRKTWTSTGSSGGLTAVDAGGMMTHSVLLCQASTLASTQSFSYQIAQASSGPWLTEQSTSIGATASVGAQAALRITGPYTWFRPYLNSASTGTYQFTLVAVS
ncbi:MAG: hypothetical protein AB7P99_04715 [Vicinamibacterales bacterium]